MKESKDIAGDIFSCGNTYMLKTIGEDGSDVLSYNFIDNAYVVDIKYRNENELEKVEE